MEAKQGRLRIDPEKMDAKLDAERARVVALLRRLADRLEARRSHSKGARVSGWRCGGVGACR